MNAFTIKDVENLSGIQAHTLRIWEQRYSFLKPQRTQTNIRYYNEEELKTILNVALLNRAGFRISRISKMTRDEMTDKILGLVSVDAKYEAAISQMIQQMLEMRLDEFDRSLTQMIYQSGLREVVVKIVFPFLERIGTLWAVGRANPAQEHFVSNIIRQKVIAETEKLLPPDHDVSKVLLFLPEGEMHELGILFTQYFIKSKGLQNWYLGANVSVHDVAYVAKSKLPDYLYTHLTGVTQNFSIERFVAQLQEAIPDVPLVISGSIVNSFTKFLPPEVKYLQSYQEMINFFETIQVSRTDTSS